MPVGFQVMLFYAVICGRKVDRTGGVLYGTHSGLPYAWAGAGERRGVSVSFVWSFSADMPAVTDCGASPSGSRSVLFCKKSAYATAP